MAYRIGKGCGLWRCARRNIVGITCSPAGGYNQWTGLTLWANVSNVLALDKCHARADMSKTLTRTQMTLSTGGVNVLDMLDHHLLRRVIRQVRVRFKSLLRYILFSGRALQPLVHVRFICVLDRKIRIDHHKCWLEYSSYIRFDVRELLLSKRETIIMSVHFKYKTSAWSVSRFQWTIFWHKTIILLQFIIHTGFWRYLKKCNDL